MSAISTYQIGQSIRLAVNIQAAAADTDPDVLRFQIRNQHGTVLATYVYGTDAQLVKASTGDYYVDWTITEELEHEWRFYNDTGVTAKGAAWRKFRVSDSLFA